MSNALIVAKVINQISKGEIELDTTLYDPQLDAHTTRGWFMEQWEQQCELHPEFENFSEEQIRRLMNCFTCNLPDEAASIMISEDSNE